MSPDKTKENTLPISLDQQMQTVSELEMQVRTELEPTILGNTALPNEVMRWWKTQDPLNEMVMLEDIAASYSPVESRDRRDMLRMHDRTIFVHGAVCLSASLLYPEAFTTENPSGWAEEILGSKGMSLSDPKSDLINLYNIIATRMQDYHISSVEDLEQLLVISEMTRSALNLNRVEEDKEFVMTITSMHYTTLDKAASYTHIPDPEDATLDDTLFFDQIRMLGLEASLLLTASAYTYLLQDKDSDFLEGNQQLRRHQLGVLIDDLHYLFNNSEASISMWKRLKQPHIKGGLHEALWFLDFCMNKEIYLEKFEHIYILPSYDNADSPHIGRPNHNRAWDFMLTNMESGLSDLVQLKSSPQTGKPGNDKQYHPAIQIIEEQNFMEVNPNRLRSKLIAYKRIFERGFQEDDRETLARFTLPSFDTYMQDLLKHFDTVVHSKKVKEASLVLDSMLGRFSQNGNQHQGMNRAQRRNAARSKRR